MNINRLQSYKHIIVLGIFVTSERFLINLSVLLQINQLMHPIAANIRNM